MAEWVSSAQGGRMTNDWSQERVVDRLQIQEVLYRYCRAIDRIQVDLLDDVFHPDAIVDKGDGGVPMATWRANVAVRHPTVPRASHMITNFLIDFIGPDSAFVETCCLAVEQHPSKTGGDTIDWIYRVRYGDRFERRDGQWRIAHRTFVMDHTMGVAVQMATNLTGRYPARRDATDPIWAMRAELGL